MDQERFDRLAVAFGKLGDRVNRRGALKAALGGAVAAVAGTTAVAEAKKSKNSCKGYAKRCDRDNDCCSGNCINGFCFPGGGGGGNGGNCNKLGQACGNNNNCCSGFCLNGICTGGGANTCNNNNDCNNGFYCCTNVYGNYNQCVPYGSSCNGNGGGGSSCNNNYCGSGFKCCQVNGVKYCVLNGTSCGNNGGGGGGGNCPSGMKSCNGQFGTMCCPSGMKCCGNGRCCPSGFSCGGVGCMNVASTNARSSDEVVDFTPALTLDEAEAEAGDTGGGKHRKRKHKK